MISRLVLLFDSAIKPFGDVDLKAIRNCLDRAHASGIMCESIDTKGMPVAGWETWRDAAWIVSVRRRLRIRQTFGSKRAGGLPLLGKQVPALFVYEDGKAEPSAVYPHEKGGKYFSVQDYLAALVQAGASLAKRPSNGLPSGYSNLLENIKARIHTAQVKAALSVNRELVYLYWTIGRDIAQRQQQEGWGKAVVEQLASDLQKAFPGLEGFSARNIWHARAFYLAYAEDQEKLTQPVSESRPPSILKQPVSEIPWGHNIVLLQKLKDPAKRLWYAQQAIVNGWSRAMLVHWIESDLHARQGKAVTNFPVTLPPPQSDLAAAVIKDPYNFDFLTLRTDAAERELEEGLLAHIRRFLLELGAGFAFVGQQYHLVVGGEDFYIDLLFYHLRLRRYIVIDLKAGPFKAEYAGKMNLYLSAVDDHLRQGDDKPSIGLILCKTRNKVIAEYALRDVAKPVGVARYVTRLVASLPAKLKGALPAPRDIEAELRKAKDKGVGDGE
ncbi:MAG: YhcG family protein [Phycisphaerae bacterium]